MLGKQVIRGIVWVELAFLGASYWCFHKMNTSQEYRRTMYDKLPWALESFYWVAEFSENGKTARKNDYEKWGIGLDPKE